MSLNLDAIGTEWVAGERTWNSTTALVYALGVGAGAEDALSELEFTTENTRGSVQKVLPTFAVTLGSGASDLRRFGDFPLASILHAEQSLSVYGSLPSAGTCETTARLVDILDKGSGAMLITEADLRNADTGELMAQNRSAIFVRGEGGFGGKRGQAQPWKADSRSPDHIVHYETRRDQALLYRLSGDRNPLHTDPKVAADAGFERPILHGLCTFGFTGRALLHAACESDPAKLGSISARFTAPVLPGETLTVKMWEHDDGLHFQTLSGGRLVLDRGVLSRNI